MHRALAIHEALCIIAANLPRRADLVAMGMCCQDFYDPAMDELWRTTPSLACLVKCLPEECWEILPESEHGLALRIKSPPEPEQWARFRQHARRVRTLESTKRDVARRSCRLLSHYYPEPWLLPNLRACYLGGPSATRELVCLMQPSLESLRYTVNQALHPDAWRLDLVSERAPNLKVLRLDDLASNGSDSVGQLDVFSHPDAGEILSNTVCSLQYLTAVHFATAFDPSAILHLSQLPHLSCLGIQLNLRNSAPLANLNTDNGVPFPALTALQLGAAEASHIIPWLQPLRLPSLKKLSISISILPALESLEELFEIVSSLPRLTSLEFHLGPPAAEGPRYTANIASLDSLFKKQPCIENFHLVGFPFTPSRSSLDTIVSAWPRLRNLHVDLDCYQHLIASSRLYLGDLLLVAQHCPDIETLALPLSSDIRVDSVNPREVPYPEEGRVFSTGGINVNSTSNASLSEALLQSKARAYLERVRPPRRRLASNLRVLQIIQDFRRSDVNAVASFLGDVFPLSRLDFAPSVAEPELMAARVKAIMAKKDEHVRLNKIYDAVFWA